MNKDDYFWETRRISKLVSAGIIKPHEGAKLNEKLNLSDEERVDRAMHTYWENQRKKLKAKK